MSDEREHIETVPHNGRNHTLAKGFIAGATVGAGLGLLFAPRRGSDLRKEVKVQVNHIAVSATTGYHRSMDTAGHWAHRGHDAYLVCRDKVTHGAHETRRYVREVADAVTLKSREHATAPAQVTASAQGTAPARVPPVVASHVQSDQTGRVREQQLSQPHDAKKDLKAV